MNKRLFFVVCLLFQESAFAKHGKFIDACTEALSNKEAVSSVEETCGKIEYFLKYSVVDIETLNPERTSIIHSMTFNLNDLLKGARQINYEIQETSSSSKLENNITIMQLNAAFTVVVESINASFKQSSKFSHLQLRLITNENTDHIIGLSLTLSSGSAVNLIDHHFDLYPNELMHPIFNF